MSEKCQNTNLHSRGGTSQQQRLLNSLLPDYVAVDERKLDDLKSFVKKYAEQIHFYDQNNTVAGDWVSYFEKKADPDQRTEPHYALFLAFLQLFKIAQDDLNQITRKHLEFYYRDVLKLKERPEVADQAFIIFELAKNVEQHLVNEGTLLKAGKDSDGKNLNYELNRDLVVNRAKVAELKALYKDTDGRLYKSPVANSADGEGEELETSEKNWRTFGKPDGAWPDQDRMQAEVGFAIASPLLFLKEGDREIIITLTVESSPVLNSLNVKEAFRVRFSGEEKWIEPQEQTLEYLEGGTPSPATVERILRFLNDATTWEDIAGVEPAHGPVFDAPGTGYGDDVRDYDIGETTAREILRVRNNEYPRGFRKLDDVRAVRGVGEDKINDLIYSFSNPQHSTTIDSDNNQIIIKRTITKDQDPIVAFIQDDNELTDPFKTEWPVAKITLRTDQDPYQYEQFSKLVIKEADVTVNVDEVRELVIQNDQSVLDPSKDFNPFGIRPDLGSNFYIGNSEAFSKQLDRLTIHMVWHGLPSDFSTHYNEYISNSRSNTTFEAALFLLDKKAWQPLDEKSPYHLFSSDSSGNLTDTHKLTIEESTLADIARSVRLNDTDAYDTNVKKGYLRLKLAGTDFGHKDYQPSYTKQILSAFTDGEGDPSVPMPKEPYTPVMKEIFLGYSSSVKIDLTAVDSDEKTEQFFHVEAFGVAERTAYKLPNGLPGKTTLFPTNNNEGSLFIGLEDLDAGQNVSMLFQVAEGSADPDLEAQNISWSYLSSNKWVRFDKFDILSDSTTGLLTSGIISFSISKNATDTNTLLTDGLHWIKATVEEGSDAISDLIEVFTQAVPATFKDQDNSPDHLRQALPAETISKLKISDSAIDSITQPFASFGGKLKEQSSDFYTRVSERLRHKNRAITIWDYEHMVLEEFPSVFKVKALNHTRFSGSLSNYSELAPGHVTSVIISNVQNKNAVDQLRPKTSLITLTQIHDFLSSHNAECVQLHVKNPIYEEIQLAFNVKFYEGFDDGFYAKQLEDDLKSFLSPWAFGGESELVFGGKLHSSVVLNHVEERSYVDFVTCFEMYHIVKDPATDVVVSRKKVDEATATTAVSILGSAGTIDTYGDHLITVLEGDDCECEDNEILPTSTIASVDECQEEDELYPT
jgi:hypothetical protein